MSSDRAPTVAIKDLCLDATDASVAADFWSKVLNLAPTATDGGDFVLRDDVDEHTLWINQVPEPRTVKQRVHLDVHVAQVGDVTALGARVLDDQLPWTVLADPEGGELCAFVRPPEALPDYRLYELGVDAVDPERITRWWGERLGLEPQRGEDSDAGPDDDVFWYLDPGPGLPWPLTFQPVPEPKSVKNRLHWDVWGTTADLLAAGATLLRSRDDEIHWDVLADPEGNEFCVFTRETA